MVGSANLLGTTLGTYTIEVLLGSGGMGSVYRAFDQNLQRPVAIKILSDEAAAAPGFADRFLQEARLIASLRHPNIVQVYNFGEQNGLSYMVQELLPGPTLEQKMRDAATRGATLSRDDVLSIVRQLASALDAAHAAGIIHRDVKPANALWNAHGALVLTDFGIAKNTITPGNHTQFGTIIGTPNYISPEQAQGLPLTPASDIYSLGVVIYELLAGEVPFDGPTPMAVLLSHINAPPPNLLRLRSDLPPDVDLIVQQALAKDPEARFRSASVLAHALETAWSPPATQFVAPPDVHSEPTSVWDSASRPAVANAPRPAMATTVPQAVVPLQKIVPPTQPKRSLLPLLAGVLAILLVGGFLLSRGSRPTTATPAPQPQPTAEPAAAVLPTDALPTDAPPSEPTAAPQPTAKPQPTAAPAPPASPIDRLRAQVAEGVSAGLVQDHGDELLTEVDKLRQSLATNDADGAAGHLNNAQELVVEGLAEGTINEQFGENVVNSLNEVANSYNLTTQPAPSNNNNDKGKPGKGKGRGKKG